MGGIPRQPKTSKPVFTGKQLLGGLEPHETVRTPTPPRLQAGSRRPIAQRPRFNPGPPHVTLAQVPPLTPLATLLDP